MAAGVPTSLESALASPRTVRIKGRDLTIRPFRMRDFGELKRWVNEQIPHPVKAAKEVADMFGLTPEERSNLVIRAYEDVKQGEYALDDPKCLKIMESPLGLAFTLWLGVRRDQPEMTLDDAIDLVGDLDMNAIRDLVEFIQGVDPGLPTSPPTTGE